MMKDKQHALPRQADDAKASHIGSKANDMLCKWVEKKHGSDELGHVAATHKKTHDQLGIILDWTKKHHIKVDMRHYQEDVSEEFP